MNSFTLLFCFALFLPFLLGIETPDCVCDWTEEMAEEIDHLCSSFSSPFQPFNDESPPPPDPDPIALIKDRSAESKKEKNSKWEKRSLVEHPPSANINQRLFSLMSRLPIFRNNRNFKK